MSGLLELLKCLLASDTEVNLELHISSCREEHGLHGCDAELFVVNNHYPVELELLVGGHSAVGLVHRELLSGREVWLDLHELHVDDVLADQRLVGRIQLLAYARPILDHLEVL